MRVSLGETMKKFRRRNLATGVSTSEARRQEAEYDQALQGMRSTDIGDTARIQEEGAMNRLMAAQEFGGPLQEEQTEAVRLGNVGTRFARGIEQDYGEGAVRDKLGLPPIIPRTNVFFADRRMPEGTRPKAAMSSVRPDMVDSETRARLPHERPVGSGSGGWGEDVPLPGQVEQPLLPQAPAYGTMTKKKKPTFLQSFLDNFRRPTSKFRL